MKKLILSAAMLAFGSFTAFGAACVSGSTVATLTATTCQVSNGAYTWDLSGWGMNPGNSQNYSPNANPAATDIIVTIAAVTGNGTLGANGALGFSVTFSDNTNGTASPNNFFNAITGQSANWETFFAANDQGTGAADIKEVYHAVTGGTSTGNGQVTVAKNINFVNGVPQNPNIVANILYAGGVGPIGANPAQITLNTNTGLVGVLDTYAIQASNVGIGGTASITSYTNYFFAAPVQTGVPEPMSFVLMGAGLVGIAVLRRRNG